jgi:glycosyltransferase involved in cell wall biosynthesis
MSIDPRVVLGLPAYNQSEHLDEALQTLLAQRYANFAIVAIDDHSGDGTHELLVHYAELDERLIHVSRNSRRLGMIGNFNRTLRVARELRPEAEFFAWVSDHDIWHPYWLESLVAELEADTGTVLVYPIYLKVSDDGKPLGTGGWRFNTSGLSDRRRRLRTVTRQMSAGNMIYGLFRVAALSRIGGQHRTLLPDRLLIAEASLLGRFRQIPEMLWYRRHRRGRFSIERQRQSLFGSRRPPWTWLPWSLTHPFVLAWSLGVRGTGRPDIGRIAGWTFALESAILGVTEQLSQTRRWLRKRR